MKRIRSHRGSFIREAENYDLGNYPSVWGHWRYDETSGLTLTDQVKGCSITMPQDEYGGTINFGVADGIPAYSVGWRYRNINPLERVQGVGEFDVIPKEKYAISMLCFRSINDPADAAAGNTPYCNGSSSWGLTFNGTVRNVHYGFKDVNDRSLITLGVLDPPPVITVGQDYVLCTIYRPAGENCELVAYNPDGSIAYQDTSLFHDPDSAIALDDIRPGNLGPTSDSYAGVLPDEELYPGTGTPWYQKTMYVLSNNPTVNELKLMAMWHLATATIGIKGPYPAFKYRE